MLLDNINVTFSLYGLSLPPFFSFCFLFGTCLSQPQKTLSTASPGVKLAKRPVGDTLGALAADCSNLSLLCMWQISDLPTHRFTPFPDPKVHQSASLVSLWLEVPQSMLYTIEI